MLRHAVLALVLLAATASAFSPATGRPLRRRTAVLRHLSADADPLTKEESRELLAAIEKVEVRVLLAARAAATCPPPLPRRCCCPPSHKPPPKGGGGEV